MSYHRPVDDSQYQGSDLPSMRVPHGVTVRDVIQHPLLNDVMTLVAGVDELFRSVDHPRIQKSGLALVADDQVDLTRLPSGQVVGRAPALLRHHLELRGIGIINVRDLFGATAVRNDKWVQLLVELCPWTEGEDFDRLGLDDETTEVLGEEIATLRIPVRSGRNMAVILEVAARNHILKTGGHHAARNFVTTIAGGIASADVESNQ